MAKQEMRIQYWNDPEDPVDHDKDSFWISDAAQTAVGLYWYTHHRNLPRKFPDTLTIRVDRDRGVVIVSDD